MNNIIEYLWQAVQYVDSSSVRILDTLVKKGTNLKWYFYSEKKNKILRKKKENTTIQNFLNEIESTRKSKYSYAGILYRMSEKNSIVERSVINNTQLVQLLFSDSSQFIFISTAYIEYPHFFRAQFSHQQIYSKQPNKKFNDKIFIDPFYMDLLTINLNKPQQLKKMMTILSPQIQNSVKKIVKDLQKITLEKSKVNKLSLEFICDLLPTNNNNSKLVSFAFWSSQVRFSKDIYLLSFVYEITSPSSKITSKKNTRNNDKQNNKIQNFKKESQKQQQSIFNQSQQQQAVETQQQCSGCRKSMHGDIKEVDYDRIIYLRNYYKISKYGIDIQKAVFEVCEKCFQICCSQY